MIYSSWDRSSLKSPKSPKSSKSPRSPKSPTTSMRRPSFFRKRSKSVPTIAWADIPAEEAGILFSAAEKAAARRRRPKSEYSPNAIYWETVPTVQWPQEPASTDSNNVPYPTGLNSNPYFSETPETASPQTPRYDEPSPEYQQISYSDDEPAEDASVIDLDGYTPPALPTPTPSFQSHRSTLRDYAASLRLFTQTRLEIVVPQSPPSKTTHSIAPSTADSYFTCLSPPDTPQTCRMVLPERPKLTSHFSDWSQASEEDEDAELEPELDPFSQFVPVPAAQTPEQSPRFADSPSCEATPRVGSFQPSSYVQRQDSAFMGSPGPIQSDTYLFDASSLLELNTDSPFRFEPQSYFDAWSTDNSVASSPWPLKPSVEDALRTSLPQLPVLPASGLSQLLAPLSLDSPLHSPRWLVPMVS